MRTPEPGLHTTAGPESWVLYPRRAYCTARGRYSPRSTVPSSYLPTSVATQLRRSRTRRPVSLSAGQGCSSSITQPDVPMRKQLKTSNDQQVRAAGSCIPRSGQSSRTPPAAPRASMRDMPDRTNATRKRMSRSSGTCGQIAADQVVSKNQQPTVTTRPQPARRQRLRRSLPTGRWHQATNQLRPRARVGEAKACVGQRTRSAKVGRPAQIDRPEAESQV